MSTPESDSGIPLRVGDRERPGPSPTTPPTAGPAASGTEADSKAHRAHRRAEEAAHESARARAAGVASKAGRETEEARRAVRSAARELREEGSRLVDDAREGVKDAVASVGRELSDLLREMWRERLHGAASRIGGVADGLHAAQSTLDDEGQPLSARAAGSLADRVQSVADYVDQTHTRDMLREVERFGRREPVIFLGGVFLLGFAAARFLKASPEGTSPGARPAGGERHGDR